MILPLLLALAIGAQAAPLDCDKRPRKALAGLIKRTLDVGSKIILREATASVAGEPLPTLRLIFKIDEEESHSFDVIMAAGDKPDEIRPAGLFIVRMLENSGGRERWMFRATLEGKLELAGLLQDPLDDKGRSKGTHMARLGPFEPRASAAYERELKLVCGLAKRNAVSLQDELKKLDIQMKAAEAKKKALEERGAR